MDIYENVQLIGGQGGVPFNCTGGSNGKVLEKIGVWAGEWQIKAIRVWLTDETPETYGNPSGSYKEFAFDPGERITKLSLWGNGAGTRTGWIRFQTDRNRTFDHGMTKWGKKQEYPINVSSGICVGTMGSAGADIDNMGFVFLKPIEYSQLKDVSYPTLALETAGIMPETLDQYTDKNTGNESRSWKFSGSRTVTTSSSWSFTDGLEVYSEVSVKASVPEVASVEGKFGWKVSSSATHQTSSSTERTLSWEQSGTLGPGDSISLTALTRKGSIVLPYEGTMEVRLKSGYVFTYPVKGMYEGVSYTGVEITDS
ncbi:jacalin-like lectin [Arhodomonas sp. AD133]|uniref:jacalin-like lectin n=1 Tax=Arhodomonas sp. AD133 TaxID=3415009 RepID=UPI003EC09976